MGRYGRPKLPDHVRRTAGTISIRLNHEERQIVEEKASQAGVTPHEWARLAALQRDPPFRQLIPEINCEASLEMARLMATLNGAVWRFQPGAEGAIREAIERLMNELAGLKKMLIGASL